MSKSLWQRLNELSHQFKYDSDTARLCSEAAEALKLLRVADEPTFVLSVKLSLVVDGWANAGSPLTRESIAELVKSRLDCDGVEGLIDEVQIIEVRDTNERFVVGAQALGEWK